MIIYYLIINIIMSIITLLVYAVDKYRAIKNKYRIKENTLLTLSFLFGSIGGLISIYLIRHKSKHLKFIILNWLFFLFHILIAILLIN